MLRRCIQCVIAHYHKAIIRPRQHKAYLIGHTLAFIALVLGAFGYYEPEHWTGAAGVGLIVRHIILTEA